MIKRSRCTVIVCCLLSVALFGARGNGCNSKSNTAAMQYKPDTPILRELAKKVLAKDWDALDMAETAGNVAVPLLADLSENSDPEVRLIAFHCLSLTDDEEILGIMANALSDEEKEIRTLAIQYLNSKHNRSIIESLIYNLDNDDEIVRGGVAILLGNVAKIGEAKAMDPLYKRSEIETNKEVERDMALALAKLGDSKMKDRFASQLDVPDSETRYRGIEDLRYINDKALAKRLLPALDDLGEAYLLTGKGAPEPKWGRVCDAAINLIGELYDTPFSFEVSRYKIYSAEEIQEAKEFLKLLRIEHESE